MELKEGERIVVAKPVALRPTCSTFRSFSELLAGAINGSPRNVGSQTSFTAIRPKTVRLKPTMNRGPADLVSSQSQAEIPGTLMIHTASDNILEPDTKPTTTVVYKPLAKLVSMTTVTLLANMGNQNDDHHQLQALQIMQTNRDRHNFRSHLSANLNQNVPSRTATNQTSETSKTTIQDLGQDPKNLPPTKVGVDRPSYDGYNWRKYGQKQVKGSEYPRSYYKCTHPNCPVKKKVERSLDGEIAEIVYKGEHNHSKPQPPKRSTQGTGLVAEGTSHVAANNQLWNGNNPIERNEGSEGRQKDQKEVGLSAQLAYQGNALVSYDPIVNGATILGAAIRDDSCDLSAECEEAGKGNDAENEPPSKRRKNDNQASEVGISGEAMQEPRIVVQSSMDTEMIGDGFRWRKYGQKVVKGNPYPRSYYRCTSLKCNVRKHVERASEDPKAFITTYEGEHNHDMPLRSTNAEQDSQAASKGKF